MAEIRLYDYTEIIHDDWWGDYEQFNCIGQGNLSASVVVPLIESVPDGEDITAKINSIGGFVFDGWSIYNALIAAKKRGCKITVRIEGLAASIASIIAMAGDEVIICQAALLMIHKPTVDLYWYGSMDAEALKREALALDQIQAVLNDIYASKTSLDTGVIDSMINAETWITPSQAVTLGFADSVDATIISDQPTGIPENAFNHIFKNADAQTRAYANKTIKINKAMNVQEALKKSNETQEKTNSLLTELTAWFKNIGKPKNETEVDEAVNASSDLSSGGKVYYDGDLGVGTEVFSDEAMTEHLSEGDHDLADGNYITVDAGGLVTAMEKKDDTVEDSEEVTNLKNEVESLKAALEASNASLIASNEALTKIKNIKSAYTPPSREQENADKNKKVNNEVNPATTKEAREARKAEIKNKK